MKDDEDDDGNWTLLCSASHASNIVASLLALLLTLATTLEVVDDGIDDATDVSDDDSVRANWARNDAYYSINC